MNTVSDFIAFETERMLLRPLNSSDENSLHRLYSQLETMKYITGRPRTFAETRQRLRRNIRQHRDFGFGLYACICKSERQFIGRSGAEPIIVQGELVGDLAWMFDPPLWNRGLATEFGRGMIEYCWRKLSLRRIMASTHPDNGASIRVMQKLEMTFEGLVDGRLRFVMDRPSPMNDETSRQIRAM